MQSLFNGFQCSISAQIFPLTMRIIPQKTSWTRLNIADILPFIQEFFNDINGNLFEVFNRFEVSVLLKNDCNLLNQINVWNKQQSEVDIIKLI